MPKAKKCICKGENMKKKTMKKKTAIVIGALGMALCFAGCGDSKDTSTTAAPAAVTEAATEAPKGTTGTWGIYAEFFIPEGMKLTGGSQIDKEDQNAFWIQKEDNAMNYYLFGVSTEEGFQSAGYHSESRKY
jgi:hypothetical protein